MRVQGGPLIGLHLWRMTDDARTARSAACRASSRSSTHVPEAWPPRPRWSRSVPRSFTAHDVPPGRGMKAGGGAIHAVFPSASSAVMCGLEIVDTEELNAHDPGRPIGLGVGVHAGEAVETAEGYIGSAVNVAARLCAIARPARPGEQDRQGHHPGEAVGFIAKGRRRLKGITDPVEVYGVGRSTAMPATPAAAAGGGRCRRVRRRRDPGRRGPLRIATAGQPRRGRGLALAEHRGGPAAGRRTARRRDVSHARFDPGFKFDVNTGWAAEQDAPGIVQLVREDPATAVDFLRVQEVIGNPCIEGGEGGPIGPGPADLLTNSRASRISPCPSRRPCASASPSAGRST